MLDADPRPNEVGSREGGRGHSMEMFWLVVSVIAFIVAATTVMIGLHWSRPDGERATDWSGAQPARRQS